MLGCSFLPAAIDLLLPVQIEEFVVVDGWSEYLLGLALEYSVAELFLLQFQQLLYLFLELVLLDVYLVLVQP